MKFLVSSCCPVPFSSVLTLPTVFQEDRELNPERPSFFHLHTVPDPRLCHKDPLVKPLVLLTSSLLVVVNSRKTRYTPLNGVVRRPGNMGSFVWWPYRVVGRSKRQVSPTLGVTKETVRRKEKDDESPTGSRRSSTQVPVKETWDSVWWVEVLCDSLPHQTSQ